MCVSNVIKKAEEGRATFGVRYSSDEVYFGEIGYAPVHAAATSETGELRDKRRGHDFVVSAALLHLCLFY